MEIRYHHDEHVDRALSAGLRQRGVDVTTTVGAGLAGDSDEDQLAFAAAHERVFVTRDRHFLVLDSRGVAHAGIAFWHFKRRDPNGETQTARPKRRDPNGETQTARHRPAGP